MRITNALEQLADAARRDERKLRYESKFVDEGRRAILTRLANLRRSSVEDLRREPATPTGHAQLTPGGRETQVTGGRGKRGSVFEWLEELLRTVRVAIGGRNSGDSIAACRRSVNRAEALYDRALALPWPSQTAAGFVEQRGAVRAITTELRAIQF